MMLTELPFVSQALCYMAELAIIGNPLYPKFDMNDVRRSNCTEATGWECGQDLFGLKMFINSVRFRPIVGAIGEWKECSE